MCIILFRNRAHSSPVRDLFDGYSRPLPFSGTSPGGYRFQIHVRSITAGCEQCVSILRIRMLFVHLHHLSPCKAVFLADCHPFLCIYCINFVTFPDFQNSLRVLQSTATGNEQRRLLLQAVNRFLPSWNYSKTTRAVPAGICRNPKEWRYLSNV